MSTPQIKRSDSHGSVHSTSSDGSTFVDKMGSSGRRSMDDERRELPSGWIRAFDPKTEHHFYVDTATKRSIWVHPYDDPTFIASIPDTHPAHPESSEAREMREQMLREREAVEKMQAAKNKAGQDADIEGHDETHESIIHTLQAPEKHKNWLSRQKAKIKMKEHEWEEHRKEKKRIEAERKMQLQEQQEQWLKRRRELVQQQLNDPNTQQRYPEDPYGYAPPTSPYSRAYVDPYGYGYNGGYGYRSGYGYGGLGVGALGGLVAYDSLAFGGPFGYGWGYDPFLFGGFW